MITEKVKEKVLTTVEKELTLGKVRVAGKATAKVVHMVSVITKVTMKKHLNNPRGR